MECYFLYTKKNPIGLLKLCIDNQKIICRNRIIEFMAKLLTIELNEEQHESFIKILSCFEILPQDNVPKILKTLINLLQYNINIMKLHFEYTVDGKGFNEARDDFIKSIK